MIIIDEIHLTTRALIYILVDFSVWSSLLIYSQSIWQVPDTQQMLNTYLMNE